MSDSDFDSDDSLRALLRGGDPAGSLPPADPAALRSLLEDIMSADLDVRPSDPLATVPRRRTRATWLVAAAAVGVIAAGGAFAVAGLGDDGSKVPEAGHQPTTTVATTDGKAPVAGETTQLKAEVPRGKCAAAPTATMLAGYSQAFEGTVTAIEGDTITLEATDVYQGDVGETVEVTGPPAGITEALNQVQFQVGGTYLVSTWNGSISMCGYSGPASGPLESLYKEAFVH